MDVNVERDELIIIIILYREFGEVYSYRGRALDRFVRSGSTAGATPTYPRGATMAARGAAYRGRGGATPLPRGGATKAVYVQGF